MEVLQRDRLVYLPVPKNASTMFTQMFEAKGWNRVELDDLQDDLTFFGHVQDPHVRHSKGVVEFLSRQGLIGKIDLEEIAPLLTHSMFDVHTYPISMLYPDHYERAHWIPLDLQRHDFNANILTSYFLQKNGLSMKIPKNTVVHASSPEGKRAYQSLNEIKKKHPSYLEELSFWFLSKDIQIHADSIRHYSSTRP